MNAVISRSIKIYDTSKNRPLYSREFLNNIHGQQLLKKIYTHNSDAADSNKILIKCLCIGEEGVPMCIKQYGKGNKYGISSYPSKAKDHFSKCKNHPTKIKKTTKSENKVNKEDDEEETLEKPTDKRQAIISQSFEETPPKETESGGGSKSTNEFSRLFTRGEVLLSYAWYNSILENKRIPKETNVFYHLYTNLRNNYVKKPVKKETITLSDFTFNPYTKERGINVDGIAFKAYHSIRSKFGDNAKMYILMKYDSCEAVDEEFAKINLIDPLSKNTLSLYSKIKYLNSKFKKNSIEENPLVEYMVSANVQAEEDTLWINKIAFIPVLKDRGIFVESVAEAELAQNLIDKYLLFDRPPQSDPVTSLKWNSYIPDFLILNTATMHVSSLIEVINDTEGFEDRIEFFNELQEYDFIYWRPSEEDFPESALSNLKSKVQKQKK